MCEYTVIDFVNIMRLPNAKYAFLSAWESLKHAPKIKGRACRIDCPTLRISGKNDKIIPIDYLDDYNEIPQIEIEVIDNCGHIPQIEKPITFSKSVLSFLRNSYHENRMLPSSFYEW
jgi:pimeloyl-ACP methyl ester carboxylesterase